MPIKAIETKYRGYRFRSRTEARWAVFFETLGIEWEYEPEGFVLPNNECYLPDFRVKTVCGYSYMEVKPTRPSFSELGKMAHLMSAANRYAVFLIGTPDASVKPTLLHADFHAEFASADFEPVSIYSMAGWISEFSPAKIRKAVSCARAERFSERRPA